MSLRCRSQTPHVVEIEKLLFWANETLIQVKFHIKACVPTLKVIFENQQYRFMGSSTSHTDQIGKRLFWAHGTHQI